VQPREPFDRAIRRVALRLVAGVLPFRWRVLVDELGDSRSSLTTGACDDGRRVLLSVALTACFAAAPRAAVRPPRRSHHQWVQAGRKVDFAITQTKVMIQKRARLVSSRPAHAPGELYTERARYAGWSCTNGAGCAATIRARSTPPSPLLKTWPSACTAGCCANSPAMPGPTKHLSHGARVRELGEFDNMRETYEKLIETYRRPLSLRRLPAPRSCFDPRSHQGEHYYN